MLLKSTIMLLTAIALVAGSAAQGRAISVELSGTARLPAASGEAKVERKRGYTEIELDEMVPASKLKGSGAKLDRKSARLKLN